MIKLVRLDYRLLHGQVVFGWVNHISAQRIIIVDDAAANDELKKSALSLSKPTGVRLNIFTLEKALAKMPKVETLDENMRMRIIPKRYCLWELRFSCSRHQPTKKKI